MFNTKRLLFLMIAASVTMLLFSCASTTRTVDPENTIHYDAGYDFSDKKQIVDELTASLLTTLSVASDDKRPVMIVYPIANRTDEHIDTGGVSDDIRMKLINSGKFRFLNEAQRNNIARELAYQYNSGNVAAETRIQRARQLGAQYILSGTLRSISKKQPRQFRLRKKTLKYYSLNLEVTDLTTGLVEWADSVELAREASKPIIGW